MPRDDGSIPSVTVPVLPWKQEFKPGDTVRVIDTPETDGFGGDVGLVVLHDRIADLLDQVMVELDEGGVWNFTPGELRPVTA